MENLSRHDAGLSATLAEHGMVQGANALATVTAATPTLIALAKMQRERLSGLGIVNTLDGNKQIKLLANLSASDLRGLTPERVGALALPVGAFLLFMHPKSAREGAALTYEDALLDSLPAPVKEGRWEEALSGMPLVHCAPDATLREVISVFVQYGVHRVYVCQGEVPVGVVTPTDVLRAIVSGSKAS
jgi:CBS domain-containing protein